MGTAKKQTQPKSNEATKPRQVVKPATAVSLSLSALPEHTTTRPFRQSAVLQLQQRYGNNHVQRLLQHPDAAGAVQRKKGKGSGKSKGQGPGKVKNAKEEFYDVSGATLNDITGQLGPFDGHASETYTALTIDGRVKPTKNEDDTYTAKVKWKIVDGVVRMPRWVDYGKACTAAQNEWDRFMTQVRLHEQEAHVDVSDKFVQELGEEDTVITGSSVEEVQTNLEAKQQELTTRLQALHDACDHGAAIDAVLHPDNGACEEEGESAESEWTE